MGNLAESRFSETEYLQQERLTEAKHEYLDGGIRAMSGASARHNMITGNIFAYLRQMLRGTACRPFASDMRLKVNASGLYTYPDILVVCDKPEFTGDQPDTLTNPTVILEVLSKSTEAYDRGKKFAHYRRLPSLRSYLLVSQEELRIERFTGSEWRLLERGDRASLEIPELSLKLSLDEVYEGLEWLDGNPAGEESPKK